jgi:hypothetical protein
MVVRQVVSLIVYRSLAFVAGAGRLMINKGDLQISASIAGALGLAG